MCLHCGKPARHYAHDEPFGHTFVRRAAEDFEEAEGYCPSCNRFQDECICSDIEREEGE